MAWEYSVPRSRGEKKPSGQPRYTWAVIRSECSVSCGGGRSCLTPRLVEGSEGPRASALTGPHHGLVASPVPRGREEGSGPSVPGRPVLPSLIPPSKHFALREALSESVSAFHPSRDLMKSSFVI